MVSVLAQIGEAVASPSGAGIFNCPIFSDTSANSLRRQLLLQVAPVLAEAGHRHEASTTSMMTNHHSPSWNAFRICRPSKHGQFVVFFSAHDDLLSNRTIFSYGWIRSGSIRPDKLGAYVGRPLILRPPHIRLRHPPLAGDAFVDQRFAVGGEGGDLRFDDCFRMRSQFRQFVVEIAANALSALQSEVHGLAAVQLGRVGRSVVARLTLQPRNNPAHARRRR